MAHQAPELQQVDYLLVCNKPSLFFSVVGSISVLRAVTTSKEWLLGSHACAFNSRGGAECVEREGLGASGPTAAPLQCTCACPALRDTSWCTYILHAVCKGRWQLPTVAWPYICQRNAAGPNNLQTFVHTDCRFCAMYSMPSFSTYYH